jgi:hypothetical protein
MEDPEDEDWGLTLLVSRLQPTPDQMTRLLDLCDGPGGVAALVAGDTQAADDKLAPAVFRLEADPDGRGGMVATITLAYLGPHHQLTVRPQTLTVSEYESLAGLSATAAGISDVSPEAAPYDDVEGPPWMRFAAAPVLPDLEEVPAQVNISEVLEFARPAVLPEPEVAPGERSDREVAPQRQRARQLRCSVSRPLQPKQAELLPRLRCARSAWPTRRCAPCSARMPTTRARDSVRQPITRPGGASVRHQTAGVHRSFGQRHLLPHDDLRLDWAAFVLATRRAQHNVDDLRALSPQLSRRAPSPSASTGGSTSRWSRPCAPDPHNCRPARATRLQAGGGSLRPRPRTGLSPKAAEVVASAHARPSTRLGTELGSRTRSGCLDAITEIAPGGEPHPDTQRLYHELSRGAQQLSVRK